MAELTQEFDFNGRIFRYNFKDISVIQAELAQSSGEFKFNQTQLEQPDSFLKLAKSGGIEWLITTVRYLLREVIKDELQPFNLGKAETEVKGFLENMPNTDKVANDNHKKLTEVASDFFEKKGLAKLFSAILANAEMRRKIAIFTKLLTIVDNNSKLITSSEKEKTKKPSTKESLKKSSKK